MRYDIALFNDPRWYSWLKNNSIDSLARVLVSPLILPVLAYEWLSRWDSDRTLGLMIGSFWLLVTALLLKLLFS